ncbi:tRNA uridine(34) hydroxylase [Buchnera aphidicola (Tetraneura ulmi)]|uniref:oxygen-dependent tRNA uridine(34) hydroxylase TrhO n=1 Tax=Buchnera aphidicola TaxID=9 RepID=UPI003463CF7F
MKNLHNLIERKILKKKIINKIEKRVIVSFYKYFFISDIFSFRNNLYKLLVFFNVLGRVYVSEEGINAQISIPKEKYLILKKKIQNFDLSLRKIFFNKNQENYLVEPFWLLVVKIKKKIVSDGISNKYLNIIKYRGLYLNSEKFNKMYLINKKKNNAVFLDMRNSYEYAIGRFENSINIPEETFKNQIRNILNFLEPYKNKKIVMYCTGGIRCEKATSWIKYHGFKYVYQLKNGIIGYYNETKKKKIPMYFKGKNFVFDARMGEEITNDLFTNCKICKLPSNDYVNCSYESCHLLFIQCFQCFDKMNGCCSQICFSKLEKKSKNRSFL